MPTHNIDLNEHYDQFVVEQLSAGRYSNINEMLRAGLCLLEQQTREDEKKLEVLRALAAEGFRQLEQGQGIELHGRKELEDFIHGLGAPCMQSQSEAPRERPIIHAALHRGTRGPA